MLRLSYIFRHYLLYTRKKKRNHFRPNAKKKRKAIDDRRFRSVSIRRFDDVFFPFFSCLKMPNSHKPHFLKPLLPDFHSGVTIPLGFFSQHIEGKTNRKTWKLRLDATDQTWEVIQEGRRLTGGWKDFTTAHDLQIGEIVIFKHEGDMVFHVTPFGPNCCEIQYTHPHIIKEEADADDAPSFSFDYCFQAEVTASNLKEDKLYLPEGATTCTALNKQCQEIILVNK
ncbi:hypothetical protein IGI04_036509 [Brassica rapa subsp. trilocularis]|uniref:TF-B3 domain-containing protein n=1 Tax=Brassica rapa subsp. trilocularis TaxID=1813537 RepID=A0ABQ7LEP4_BRACM|nr:hypothetical protein IGI04_036509 [Brassica rapa subsp. trilocularis]